MGKEGAQALCRVVLLPTSPSGPARIEICSKSGNEPANLQIYHPSDTILSPLTHRLGMGEKHHHKAQVVQGHQAPPTLFSLPAHCSQSFHPSPDSISTCALFGSFHTFLLAGDKISGERQTKALGARHWLSLPWLPCSLLTCSDLGQCHIHLHSTTGGLWGEGLEREIVVGLRWLSEL